jgi:glutamyl-tRNA synthetase
MRVEDIDGPRVVPGMVDATLRDLEWLGLDWDGPAHIQSEGLAEIAAATRRLIDLGLAYPCVCSRTDIRQAQSAPQYGVVELQYPGTCRGRFESMAEAERTTGKPATLRFRVSPGIVRVDDGFAAPLDADVSAEVGDFVVERRAGAPAYQLAVVVDDARQGVDEVVRGDDILSSTARQVLLQRALGLVHPRWFHVPLVVDKFGQRLAKRTDALSLAELRARGVDPRRLVAWAARTAGIDAPDRATPAEVTARFAIGQVSREPVIVTRETIQRFLD